MPSRIFIRIFLLAGLASSGAFAQTEAVSPATASAAAPTTSAPVEGTPVDGNVVPVSREERQAMLARAKQLSLEAEEIRRVATEKHEAAKPECWKKILVSSCLEEARQAYRKEDIRADRMQRDARLLERNVKRYDAAEDAARHAAETAKRDAEMEAKAAQFREEEEAKAAKRAKKAK